MPQIKEYTAENDKLRPSDLGVEAYGQAARRVGAFYQQAGEVIKQSAQDKARAAEAEARAAQARAGAAGALATEEKAKAGALSGLTTTAGTAVEQAEAFAGHQEVSHGVAGFAEASNGMIQKWKDLVGNQATADPNNSSIRAGFLQGQFEPWAQKFIQGFRTPQGQDWANAEVNHLRNHLVESTAADMSTMAGIATNVNLDRTGAANANTARNDPQSLDYLVGDPGKHNGAIHRNVDYIVSTSGMSGTAAFKARTETAAKQEQDVLRAGALGGIEQSNDPEAFAKNFNSRWSASYDDPMLADSIERAGKTQARANQLDQDRAERQQTAQDNKISKGARQEYIDDLYAPYAGGKQTKTFKDVLGDNRLKNPADKEHVLERYKLAEKPEPPTVVSKKAMADVLPAVRDGQFKDITGVPKEITNKLDHSDYKALNEEIELANNPDGKHINALKKTMDEGARKYLDRFNLTTPDAYARWDAERTRRMQKLQSDGKDPNAVFDSSKPEYMGGKNTLDQFRRPLSGRIEDNGGVGAPAAGKPASDYDYEAATKAGVKPDERGHLPDTYKLPNHITFSEESKYSTPEHQGGKWVRIEGEHWQFTPSLENFKHHSLDEMRSYFKQYEPKSDLIEPPRVTTREQFDKVKKGGVYIGSDGKPYEKP